MADTFRNFLLTILRNQARNAPRIMFGGWALVNVQKSALLDGAFFRTKQSSRLLLFAPRRDRN
jgi:hypothetical protein